MNANTRKVNLPMKVTISRMSGNGNTDSEEIRIEINDGLSGVRVVELYIPLISFSRAITGLGVQPATAHALPTKDGFDRVGKKKHLLCINLDLDRQAMPLGAERHAYVENAINEAYAKELADGWKIEFDGVNTQQNGKLWNATLSKYCTPTDEELDEEFKENSERM